MKCKCGSQHWFIGESIKGKAPRFCMNCGAYGGEVITEFELACDIPLELRRDLKDSTKYWGLYGKIKRGGGTTQKGRYIDSHKEEIMRDFAAMTDIEVAEKWAKRNPPISLSTLRQRRIKWGLPKRRRGNANWSKEKTQILSMP